MLATCGEQKVARGMLSITIGSALGQAGDRLDGDDALFARLVRERGTAHGVADGEDPRVGGALPVVDLDQPALAGRDAVVVEVQRRHVGRAAGRDAERVVLAARAADRDGDRGRRSARPIRSR